MELVSSFTSVRGAVHHVVPCLHIYATSWTHETKCAYALSNNTYNIILNYKISLLLPSRGLLRSTRRRKQDWIDDRKKQQRAAEPSSHAFGRDRDDFLYSLHHHSERVIFHDDHLLSDKITWTVDFVNCLLRVPLVYQPCCPVPSSQGKPWELSESSLQNLLYKWFCL